MKKMNNKGVTLVELIVSFAIVGVAVVYFYQTVSTVSKLYKTSKDDTNEYVNATYVLRLMDAYCNENAATKYKCGDTKTSGEINTIKDFCKKINGTDCNISGLSTVPHNSVRKGNRYYKTLKMKINGKEYKLLALLKGPNRYVVNFKYGSKTKSFHTDEWEEKWEDKFANWKVSDTTSERYISRSEVGDKTVINYFYHFKNSSGSLTINFGQAPTKANILAGDQVINEDDSITYTLDLTAERGPLFTYTGNYEVLTKIDKTEDNWYVRFTSDGDLVMKTSLLTDIFLVGGGGGGAGSPISHRQKGAGGGGGGAISTLYKTSLEPTKKHKLEIGNGGRGEVLSTFASAGGSTIIKNPEGNILFEAKGGNSPTESYRDKGGKGGIKADGCSDKNCFNGGDGGASNAANNSPTCGANGQCAFKDCDYGKIYYAAGGGGGVGKKCDDFWCTSATFLINPAYGCGNDQLKYAGKGGRATSNTVGSNGGNATESNTGAGGGGATAHTSLKVTVGVGNSVRYAGGDGSSGVIVMRSSN